MLRREADGVDWYVRRQTLLGHVEPPRNLTLSLTLRAHPAMASELVWELGALVEARTREFGIELPRRTLTVWVWDREPFAADWTAQSQLEAAERVRDDKAAALILEWTDVAVPGEAAALRASLGMNRDYEREGLWGVSLAFGRELHAATAPNLDAFAEILADALALAGARSQTRYGAVVYDFISGETLNRLPYELMYGITEGYQEADESARGYYWANLLTTRHVDKLGGLDAFAARCADHGVAATVLDRSGAIGDAAVLVRDPAPLTAFTDERLAAMRDLLDPALPHPDYLWYAGWPVRVFKQPGTAFRPIPPDIIEPWFEEDGPLPPAGTAYRLVPDA